MPSSGLIVLFNVLSGAVALLISYYAYRNNRLIGNNLLRYISIGFLLLAVGLILEATTQLITGKTLVDAARIHGVELVEFLVSTALQLVAYGVFAWGYGLSSLRGTTQATQAATAAPAAASPLVFMASLGHKIVALVLVVSIFLASQFGILFLLLFIVYHGARIFSATKNVLALMVLFGFSLIFVAHILLIASAIFLSGALLLVGETIQFCGFLSLLFFLVWSARVVK